MLRRIGSVIAGLVAAVAVIFLTESVEQALYAPVGVSTDPVAMGQLVTGLPFGAKLLVVLGWFFGTAIGAALALRLSRWRPAPWIVGVLVAAAAVANVLQVPHPTWMQVAAVIAPLLGVLIAGPIAHWSAVRAANRI